MPSYTLLEVIISDDICIIYIESDFFDWLLDLWAFLVKDLFLAAEILFFVLWAW
jgi:hypothetical protein